MAGGGLYNSFHHDTIRYLYYAPFEESHHPYSDQIDVPSDSLIHLLQQP